MKVIGLMGLPGSGKTTAREGLEQRIDYSFKGIQMKDIAGREFNRIKKNGVDSIDEGFKSSVDNPEDYVPNGELEKEIGDWVNSILEVDDEYFARLLEERIESEEEADVIVVDGVRSLPDAVAIKRSKGRSQLVFIQTPFCVRLDRIKSRGREGEEDIEVSYLVERDRQELSWGVDEIMSSYSVNDEYSRRFEVEVFYANHDDIAEFRTEFDHFIDDLLEL